MALCSFGKIDDLNDGNKTLLWGLHLTETTNDLRREGRFVGLHRSSKFVKQTTSIDFLSSTNLWPY